MNRRQKCLLIALPTSLVLLMATVIFGAGCELAVNLSPAIDGSVSDVLDCGICADVSADANYDAADVSIYGIQPGDADERDAGPGDAATGKH